jgi:hypothetical protein
MIISFVSIISKYWLKTVFFLLPSDYKLIFTRTVLKKLNFGRVVWGMTRFRHSIVDSDVGHDSSAFEMFDSVITFSFFWRFGIEVVILLVAERWIEFFLFLSDAIELIAGRRKNDFYFHVFFVLDQEIFVLVLEFHPFEFFYLFYSFDLIDPLPVDVIDLNLQVFYFFFELQNFLVLLFETICELPVVPSDFRWDHWWLLR